MSGFLSRSVLEENRIEVRKRLRLQDGASIIDLSDGNPTNHGVRGQWEPLQSAFSEYLESRRYEADPRGTRKARESIARYYRERTPSYTIDPESIFITASTSESYSLLFTLLCDPGDNCLVPEITYPLFDQLAESRHVELRTFRFSPDCEFRWSGEILDSVIDQRTRAILNVSPHNPTGICCRDISTIIRETGLPLISDEVFSEFPGKGGPIPVAGNLYSDVPVFHLNGISKMFSLPDFKLGWIALNSPAAERYAARLEFLNDLFLSASYPMQYMLPDIFRLGARNNSAQRIRVHENMQLALSAFAHSGKRIACQEPDAGVYLFPRIDTTEEHESFILRLLDAGVSVHPGYFYGWEKDLRIVISCLLEPETFAEGIRRVLCCLK